MAVLAVRVPEVVASLIADLDRRCVLGVGISGQVRFARYELLARLAACSGGEQVV